MYLGDFRWGQTIYVPFATYGSNGESITMTGIATTDIEVYKNGSMTQRASDNGYTLLDTDGIDLDSITGVHGFSIDTSDNSTAGFWGPGNEYWVAVSTITVNAQTVTALWSFSIENRGDGALNRTTIATLSTQTSWTLTAGSADNAAYNDCIVVVHDQASVVQKAVGYVLNYTGSTKTITLIADPAVFTMATGDYVTILPRSGANVLYWRGGAVPAVTATGVPKVDTAYHLGTASPTPGTAGLPYVDMLRVNNVSAAAVNLALAAGQMIPFTVDTAGFSPTNVAFETSTITEATADHYKDRIVIWTSGAMAGQQQGITAYALTSGRGHFTLTAGTEAPANAVTGIIV